MLNIVIKEGKVVKVYKDAEPDTEGIASLKEGLDYQVEKD